MDNQQSQYTREKLLGEGGMGKVYLAHDTQLQRKVAIKDLIKQSQNEQVNNALNEARLLARVNHNNIIQIYNIIDENNQVSLVMEYFKSKTLTQFQQENHLTLIQKLALLCQLSAGLAHAHKNNVVHCDLKPSNILVDDQGQVKIADFGIACLSTNSVKAATHENSQQRLYGCLQFMSPEQISGQAVDHRSDIFSLGIIAYQVIVGSHPFGNGAAEKIAENICQQTPVDAKNLLLDAPTALTDLLMAMLVKPVDERSITASEIEHRLKHIQQALQQEKIAEEHTVPVSQLVVENPKAKLFKYAVNIGSLIFAIVATIWFNQKPNVEAKHVVVLRPTITDNSLMAPMQQNLVLSAVEDAMRQAVVNTKNMYLISQREVNAIVKAYPDNLNKLKQALGASDILSTSLSCDNTRCKVNASRLITNAKTNNKLVVKAEKTWLTPVANFSGVYSTSQTQFAKLFPEHPEVNQAGLVQRPINEDDYRRYIELYTDIHHRGDYNDESLTTLAAILTRSPYLYAAYGLYRNTALNLYLDSKDKGYFERLDTILNNAPPEYKYSAYESVDRFWLASDMGDLTLARKQIEEAKKRGADELVIFALEAYMAFNAGDYEAAVHSYANIFKLRANVSALNNLAFSNWRLGDLAASEKALNKILNITPNNYRAKRLQANIWLLQGKLNKAVTAFESIIKVKSNSTDLTNLGLAYALNGQYEASLKYAKLAVDKNPNNTVRLLNLADIELILGHSNNAEKIYQKIIDASAKKNKYRDLLDLSQAYLHLNKHTLAIEALNQAKTIAPNNGEVAYTSALVYSVLNENVSALFEVEKALSNDVGASWFNLPWFDKLCRKTQFQNLMKQHNNAGRCLSLH